MARDNAIATINNVERDDPSAPIVHAHQLLADPSVIPFGFAQLTGQPRRHTTRLDLIRLSIV